MRGGGASFFPCLACLNSFCAAFNHRVKCIESDLWAFFILIYLFTARRAYCENIGKKSHTLTHTLYSPFYSPTQSFADAHFFSVHHHFNNIFHVVITIVFYNFPFFRFLSRGPKPCFTRWIEDFILLLLLLLSFH